jgi:hypothetical protein
VQTVTVIAVALLVPVSSCASSCFNASPDWTSSDSRATVDVALHDFNGDGWQITVGETKTGDGDRHFFTLKHFPALTITAIRVDGVAVARADYCFDPYRGWFSLKNAPAAGATVAVDYKWSNRLDLFAANETRTQTDGKEEVYYNNAGTLNRTPGWLSNHDNNSWVCAAADYNNDGQIEIAVNDIVSPSHEVIDIYNNTGTGLEATPSVSIVLPEPGSLTSLTWGDFDNDGFPDLAVALYGENYFQVYKNNAGTLATTPSWSIHITDDYSRPWSVAWGDMDGDGDLDLAAVTSPFTETSAGYAYVYKNIGGVLETSPCWQNTPPSGLCSALAWGDANGDGAIDLLKAISGYYGTLDKFTDIYYSSGGVLSTSPSWEAARDSGSKTSYLTDSDGDNLADLIQVGGDVQGYFHQGGGSLLTYSTWSYRPSGYSVLYGLAIGDVNGDGYLDVAAGASKTTGRPTGLPNVVFLNKGNVGITVRGFAATPSDRGIALRWETAAAVAGFNLYRAEKEVTGNAGDGTAVSGKLKPLNAGLITGRPPYRYIDAGPTAGVTYQYWLEAVLPSGTSETFGPVECTATSLPRSFALGQNYPNPAADKTTVVFSLPAAGDASVAVYDVAGRKVATAFEGPACAGENVVTVALAGLTPGVYIYRLQAEGATASRKMVVTR